MQTFTQHELEIINGHQKIARKEELLIIKQEIQKMIFLLKSEAGKTYIEDDVQRLYTLKNYQTTFEKLEKMNEAEFKKIDFSSVKESD